MATGRTSETNRMGLYLLFSWLCFPEGPRLCQNWFPAVAAMMLHGALGLCWCRRSPGWSAPLNLDQAKPEEWPVRGCGRGPCCPPSGPEQSHPTRTGNHPWELLARCACLLHSPSAPASSAREGGERQGEPLPPAQVRGSLLGVGLLSWPHSPSLFLPFPTPPSPFGPSRG